ncbi:sporulation YhaL family protein [Evansella tamaricis]|uniref:Sporulation YhaL family protein n=1 Tax=Evansella tamaricis TaxID=2069301 RepID=A0ABS6JG47_9BACI|nr:sporulation YhaL family protein [Evansella tamaricis]MBU9712654.1 sporulation YhaL family protein [Evansella tamaricis]
MNPISIIFSLLGVLFLVFVVRLLSFSSFGTSSPWWVYFLYLAILFSGIMFVYSWMEDRRKVEREIEEEGKLLLQTYKKNRQISRDEKIGKTDSHTPDEILENKWKGYSL